MPIAALAVRAWAGSGSAGQSDGDVGEEAVLASDAASRNKGLFPPEGADKVGLLLLPLPATLELLTQRLPLKPRPELRRRRRRTLPATAAPEESKAPPALPQAAVWGANAGAAPRCEDAKEHGASAAAVASATGQETRRRREARPALAEAGSLLDRLLPLLALGMALAVAAPVPAAASAASAARAEPNDAGLSAGLRMRLPASPPPPPGEKPEALGDVTLTLSARATACSDIGVSVATAAAAGAAPQGILLPVARASPKAPPTMIPLIWRLLLAACGGGTFFAGETAWPWPGG